MTEHDYAKNRQKESKQSEPELSIWMPLSLVFLVVGFGGGYWLGLQGSVYRSSPHENPGLKKVVEQQKREIASLKTERDKLLAQADEVAQVGELNFYHELPKLPVVPTPEPVPEKATPAAIPDTAARPEGATRPPESALPEAAEGYLLQVASFSHADEAAKLQARLVAAGLNAHSETVDLPQRGRWYRVYLGPYDRQSQAEQARTEVLEQFRLKALIVRTSS